MRLFACGSTRDGALCVDHPEDDYSVLSPIVVADNESDMGNSIGPSEAPSNSIVQVSCGSGHTLFRLADGRVCTCGSDSDGQLGLGSQSSTVRNWVPNIVKAFGKSIRISKVSCGNRHSCAVSDEGQLFSWGSNENGQLGISRSLKKVRTPASPNLTNVIQVVCGSEHSMALCADGRLFSWGLNSNGQLGLGDIDSSKSRFYEPRLLDSITGIPIAILAAGANRSCFISVSGAVFAWGENNHGQLGLGDHEDKSFPHLVKMLRNQEVVYISCGEFHTAALTMKGRLFTFGANIYGQLGDGSKADIPVPTVVPELMGSKVSRVACGRCHTVCILESGLTYSWGLGSDGQLGVGDKALRLVPSHVHLSSDVPFVDAFAGYDRTFILYDNKLKSTLQTPGAIDYNNGYIGHLSLTKLERYLNDYSKDRVIGRLTGVFSSLSCLNASFLYKDERRMNATRSNSNVDMDQVMEAFNLLAQCSFADSIAPVMWKTFNNSIAKELRPSPPDVEAMRVYLILPWFCVVGGESITATENWANLYTIVGNAILALKDIPMKVLISWWRSLAPRHFNRVLRTYKSILTYTLDRFDVTVLKETRMEWLRVSLQIMHQLHIINVDLDKVPQSVFYAHELASKIDIRLDYARWFVEQRQQQNADKTKTVFFSDFPFIFDTVAKTVLLETDAAIQMQLSYNAATVRNINALLQRSNSIHSPILELHVRRDHLVTDTIGRLLQTNPDDLRKPLKVKFFDEEGDDAGGVKKEFFMLLFQQLLDPKYGMFTEQEDSHLLWFSSIPHDDETQVLSFQLVGILFGLSIYNSVLIDLHFPLALYKKLLGKAVTLEDFKQLSPVEGRSLEELLECDEANVEDMFLNFTLMELVFDVTTTVELKQGGANIAVTASNRNEYVDLYVDYKMKSAPYVRDSFEAFHQGFRRVLTSRILNFFEAKELEEMVIGNENYDWGVFKDVTEYKGEYWKDHPTIKLFWEVFSEFSLEEKKKFLRFLTGTDRIPLQGMEKLKMSIQPAGEETSYPVAHTCFNLLDLPKMTIKENMKNKLLISIEHNQGFTLA